MVRDLGRKNLRDLGRKNHGSRPNHEQDLWLTGENIALGKNGRLWQRSGFHLATARCPRLLHEVVGGALIAR